jgi:MraZ protein
VEQIATLRPVLPSGWAGFVFRGSASARIDDKGRLKIPTDLRRRFRDQYGTEVFITSVLGDSVQIYPLSVWEELEDRLAALPSTDRVKRRYLERVSYYGQQTKMDAQGRIVLPPILRESAAMEGDVVVSTRLDHLEVWNRKRLDSRFTQEPFGEDDFAYLSERGI